MIVQALDLLHVNIGTIGGRSRKVIHVRRIERCDVYMQLAWRIAFLDVYASEGFDVLHRKVSTDISRSIDPDRCGAILPKLIVDLFAFQRSNMERIEKN